MKCIKTCADGQYLPTAFGESMVQGHVVINIALVLTFCICEAQSWGVEAAGFPGPCGQTDGPVSTRAWSALRLWKRNICIWRLVKYLEFRKSTSKHQKTGNTLQLGYSLARQTYYIRKVVKEKKNTFRNTK